MTILGYARISTSDQSNEFQLTALKEAGAERIYKDTASGKSMDRPQLEQLLKDAQTGDVVLVWKLDRLGRSLVGVLNVIELLTKNGVSLKSLTEKVIDTTDKNDHISKAMLGMLAVFGQLERDLIRERVCEGIAIAKAQGRMKGSGRPKALGKLDVDSLLHESRLGERTVTDICKKFKISRKTYYNIVNQNKVTSQIV